ncbi:GNAT family acetyltransferase [Paenibacillus helianthi]|uniref:GNAT family acetyltransferase n=1 Tax=Paenibacillus helianthi TaxID=1349432 RepID=A0ABX3EIE6_9BACL|nr:MULTISPECIES: GNAT family N-acetyltransferase [Paenibacillus]OKP81461.1 GNAT family acetyltransferase [Paenibacillus helianthi]OKP83183.1 GNAT family acetyltransferase [Paenibacillus sp. P3E]
MEVLETQRLTMRGFKPEDWEDLHDYLSREEVVRYEPYGVFDEEASKAEALRRSTDHAFWAVCLKASGKMIGNLYFQQQEPQAFQTWELGYVFGSGFQGQGYATEACLRLLEYAFSDLQIRRVTAHCDPRNYPSWQLLERLQLRREGHLLQTGYFKNDIEGHPLWHDTYAYGLLGSEWLSIQQAASDKQQA